MIGRKRPITIASASAVLYQVVLPLKPPKALPLLAAELVKAGVKRGAGRPRVDADRGTAHAAAIARGPRRGPLAALGGRGDSVDDSAHPRRPATAADPAGHRDHPGRTDRKVAEIPGCDHEAVTAYRRNQGGFPAIDADPQPAVSSDHSPAQVCAHPRDPTQLCVDVSVCPVCGAVVRDRQVHADWHA